MKEPVEDMSDVLLGTLKEIIMPPHMSDHNKYSSTATWKELRQLTKMLDHPFFNSHFSLNVVSSFKLNFKISILFSL
jgi:hypothetical protein